MSVPNRLEVPRLLSTLPLASYASTYPLKLVTRFPAPMTAAAVVSLRFPAGSYRYAGTPLLWPYSLTHVPTPLHALRSCPSASYVNWVLAPDDRVRETTRPTVSYCHVAWKEGFKLIGVPVLVRKPLPVSR